MPQRQSLLRNLKSFAKNDAFPGVLLIVVAAAAIAVANSPFAQLYAGLLHTPLGWSPIRKLGTLHLWINDALMAVFFFTVGLEVKREIIAGNLSDPGARRLPIMAAAAGMAVPAAIYVAIAGTARPLADGWAIPSATDIAFAVGVVTLLGTRVPVALRVFLLTVAIVDDIGAVLVIAVFYTAKLDLLWLVAALAVLGALIAFNRLGVSRKWPFILGALVLWFCVLHSGVHATIAGVAAALTVPMSRNEPNGMLQTMEHALVGWSAYLVVPVFGFANAGVALAGIGFDQLLAPLPLAIGAGLVLGKQLGIFACIWITDRIGLCRRPENSSWPEIWGTAVLCGIGFTMSLFISELAFPDAPELIEEAKLGILSGSLVSAILGYAILRMTREHPEEQGQRALL